MNGVRAGAARRVRRAAPAGSHLLPYGVLSVAMVVAVVRVVRDGWLPLGDNALITAYTLDVPSDLPLIGMPTSLSLHTGEPLAHPGPLLFWFLAPLTHLFGVPGRGIALGMVVINVALVAAVALLARHLARHARWLLATATAVVVLGALGPHGLAEPFNPNVTVLALLASLVATWVVLRGTPEGLLALAVAGSLAAQSHVGSVPLVVGLVVLVVAITIRDLRRLTDRDRLRRLQRWSLASVAAGLACWSGPLIDQVAGSGNLLRLVGGSGGTDGGGLSAGLERLVEAAGVPPVWTTRLAGGPPTSPSAWQWVTAVLVLTGLAVATARAIRVRDRAGAAGPVSVWFAVGAGVVTSSRIPTTGIGSEAPSARLFWWPVSALLWVVVAEVVLQAIRARRSRDPVTTPDRRPTTSRLLLPASTLVVVLVTSRSLVVQADADVLASRQLGQASVVGRALARTLPAGSSVRIAGRGFRPEVRSATQWLIPQLRLRGHDVQVTFDDAAGYWARYRIAHPAGGEPDVVLVVREAGDDPLPPPARLIVTYDPRHPPDGYEDLHRSGVGDVGVTAMSYYLFTPDEARDALTSG